MFKKKNLLYILIFLAISAMIPVYAVKWADLMPNSGIFIDTDSISDEGNEINVVFKFTNEQMIQSLISGIGENPQSLSVCLLQGTYDCSTGKTLSASILCYNNNGEVAIDIPNMSFCDFAAQFSQGACSNFRRLKRIYN